MKMKICRKCHARFSTHRCKRCVQIYNAKYRKKYKKKIRNYAISYRRKGISQKLRRSYIERDQLYVYNYLIDKQCIDCGDSRIEVLDFDHVRGNKKNGISLMIIGGYSIKTIQKEIDKCDIRCSNCHRIKTCKERGWFRSVIQPASKAKRLKASVEAAL